jgi:acyl carrier protein
LIIAVEQAFGIRFRVGEVEGTKNVGDLADLIVKRLSKG